VRDGCGFILPGDLSAARVQGFLAELRMRGRVLPPLVPGKDLFTKAEAAAALQVSTGASQAMMRRHLLVAVGNTRSRRYPRAALDAKNGRAAVQPLPADVVGLFRAYLRDKPAGRPVWPGKWSADGDAAEMLRIDLEAASVPYAVEGPGGPLFADFHALRHSYI